MSEDLIRQEVLDVQAEKWLGTVRLISPISFQLWGLMAVLSVGVLLLWVFMGHYTQRKHVTGSLAPMAGLLSVSARAPGIVSVISVKEGMFVHAGDPVGEVSDERFSVTLGSAATNISAQIREQKRLIEAALINAEHLADQERDDLAMQKLMLLAQIKQLNSQISIQQREIKTQSEFLERIGSVAEKGFVSVLMVNQLKASEDEAELQLKSLNRDRLDLQQKENSVENSLSQLPLTTAGKIIDLKKQLSQVEETLQSNEADRATMLRAPKDGIVSSVLVRRGQQVVAAQPLLTIVPAGSPLQAVLLVPSSAIGFVRIGTKVAIHYEAFPYQKFGVHYGHITGISRNALMPAEVEELHVGKTPEEPVYRVEVALTKQSVNVYGKSEQLMPGMAIEASLLLDERRIIEWLFEPVYGMRNRS